jgi:hypothetical protein
MSYSHSIAMALEAAKIRADYYHQQPDIRFLEEMSDWIHVAVIYLKQELVVLEKNVDGIVHDKAKAA